MAEVPRALGVNLGARWVPVIQRGAFSRLEGPTGHRHPPATDSGAERSMVCPMLSGPVRLDGAVALALMAAGAAGGRSG
jgi:hypothetical protein